MDQKVVATFVAVLALGTASCGGSAPAPLTQAQLTQRANAVCKHRVAQMAAVQQRHRGDVGALLAATLPVVSNSLDELRALEPPAELKATYAQFITEESAGVSRLRETIAAQRAGHLPSHARSVALLERRVQLTSALGLSACA